MPVTPLRYDCFSILLHWLIAVLTIGLFASGLWMVGLDYYHAWYYRAPWWHKSAGVIVVVLVSIRWIWGFQRHVPLPLDSIPQWQSIVAKAVHGLMNGMILLLGISGYLMVTAKGDGLDVFDWFHIPALFTDKSDWVDKAGSIHLWLGYLLIIFAGTHALAAMKHHFVDKDATLRRMLMLTTGDNK